MKERILLLAFRQALLIMLGALETYLGITRSVAPKHLQRTHSDTSPGMTSGVPQ